MTVQAIAFGLLVGAFYMRVSWARKVEALLRRRIRDLRDALAAYATHMDHCQIEPCSCGLRQLLLDLHESERPPGGVG